MISLRKARAKSFSKKWYLALFYLSSLLTYDCPFWRERNHPHIPSFISAPSYYDWIPWWWWLVDNVSIAIQSQFSNIIVSLFLCSCYIFNRLPLPLRFYFVIVTNCSVFRCVSVIFLLLLTVAITFCSYHVFDKISTISITLHHCCSYDFIVVLMSDSFVSVSSVWFILNLDWVFYKLLFPFGYVSVELFTCFCEVTYWFSLCYVFAFQFHYVIIPFPLR